MRGANGEGKIRDFEGQGFGEFGLQSEILIGVSAIKRHSIVFTGRNTEWVISLDILLFIICYSLGLNFSMIFAETQ